MLFIPLICWPTWHEMVILGSQSGGHETCFSLNLPEEWGDTPTECGFGSSEAWQKVYSISIGFEACDIVGIFFRIF